VDADKMRDNNTCLVRPKRILY